MVAGGWWVAGFWFTVVDGGWWIGFSDSGGGGLVGGLDFLMVVGGIAVGCFCWGEDRTERERGRRIRIKKN